MKQFIVLMAVLPLMLVFFAQFTLDQINSSRIGILTDFVYLSKEEARQDGCFTASNLASLRSRISNALGIDEGDIEIEATESVQYRVLSGSGGRGLVHIKLRVPIGQVMAGRSLFGIRQDNTYYYTVESYGASERLR
ncbi:MAG: hypothetical protein II971_06195 [Firmicutes bacterium]|nr:hypothetical protein [Bacillota bacterium]